jgi:hypothetical protein
VRKILRLDIVSVARFFAIFYAVAGIYFSSKSAIMGEDAVLSPLGLVVPFCQFTLNVTIHLSKTGPSSAPFVVVVSAVLYAITGAISGGVIAVLFNISAWIWPGIWARVSANERPGQRKTGIGLI